MRYQELSDEQLQEHWQRRHEEGEPAPLDLEAEMIERGFLIEI